MKTAAQILDENFKHKGVSNIISKQGLVYKGTIKAMETYATQQTADLTTQLAKANSDKDKLGELLKERVDILKEDIRIANTHQFYEEEVNLKNKLKQITECLTDCGITL